MKPFDIGQTFIEQHARRASLEELRRTFQWGLRELGVRYFACCPHGDPLDPPNPALVFQTYPADWVRSFSESGLHRIDPVFRYAAERALPFRWDDPEFRATLTPVQRGILLEAERHGIAHGCTIPIHAPREHVASCSVVPESNVMDGERLQVVFTMAHYLYEAMCRAADSEVRCTAAPTQFSERERQCLELAAQGKDDWTIGSILQISERTAHNHLERAKKRLGVGTRVQVIVHALRHGQLSYGDVLRAEVSDRGRAPGCGAGKDAN
jgi:DNA-binding CsgD family transcriptional regulator